MAFEPDNNALQNALRNLNTKKNDSENKSKIDLSKFDMSPEEKVHPYTITLKPSIHDKGVRLAKKYGFRSFSAFSNALLESIEE